MVFIVKTNPSYKYNPILTADLCDMKDIIFFYFLNGLRFYFTKFRKVRDTGFEKNKFSNRG